MSTEAQKSAICRPAGRVSKQTLNSDRGARLGKQPGPQDPRHNYSSNHRGEENKRFAVTEAERWDGAAGAKAGNAPANAKHGRPADKLAVNHMRHRQMKIAAEQRVFWPP